MLIEPRYAEGFGPIGLPDPARRAGPAQSPSAGLAGSDLADRFCFWRGRSGRRYVFSVYRSRAGVDDVPRYADAVVIAARREGDGMRTALEVGVTGHLPELSPVLSAGLGGHHRGIELHFHLLAGTAAERRAVADDLAGADHRARSLG